MSALLIWLFFLIVSKPNVCQDLVKTFFCGFHYINQLCSLDKPFSLFHLEKLTDREIFCGAEMRHDQTLTIRNINDEVFSTFCCYLFYSSLPIINPDCFGQPFCVSYLSVCTRYDPLQLMILLVKMVLWASGLIIVTVAWDGPFKGQLTSAQQCSGPDVGT